MRTLSPTGDVYLTFHPDTQSPNPNNNTTSNNDTLLVSSTILSHKSPVFSRMLNGPYNEAHTLATQNTVTINLPDDNPSALFTVLNLLHDRPYPPSPMLTLESLAHVASAVEKYMLHRLGRNRHVRRWMHAVMGSPRFRAMGERPDANLADIMLWLAAARAFQWTAQATHWRRVAICETSSCAEVDLDEFPFARSIHADIQRKRLDALTRVQTFLQREMDARRPQRGGTSEPYWQALWDALVFGHLNTVGTQWGLLPGTRTRKRAFPGVRLCDLAWNARCMVDLNRLMVAERAIIRDWVFDPRSPISELKAVIMIFAGFVPRSIFEPEKSVCHPDDLKVKLLRLLRAIDHELDLKMPQLDAELHEPRPCFECLDLVR